MATTIPVRDGEGFQTVKMAKYLRDHLSGLPGDGLRIEQFAEGHSNLTYLVSCGKWKAVLRRPPLGPVAPKAHDMRREFQVLRAVRPYVPEVPAPLLFCDDTAVIGTPFYLMEYMEGEVVNQFWPETFPDTVEARQQASQALIEKLAAVHSVDVRDFQIAAIGHADGYMRRQVEGWYKRHQMAQTEDKSANVKKVGDWLLDNLPDFNEATLIHNDFKFNNVVFEPVNPKHIRGIVDWEMATVGNPLSDLAIMLSYWAEAADPPVLSQGLDGITAQAGFFSRDELMERYALLTGRDMSNMKYYLAFAYYKSAGICQQIYYRWQRGQTKDQRFEKLGELAKGLLAVALTMTRK